MTEQLVSFDTAELAMQNRFDVKCNKIYNHIKEVWTTHYINMTNSNPDPGAYCTAPTQTILQKWLREVHKILLWVEPLAADKWEFGINYPNGGFGDAKEYNTYEEALEIGLQEALKLIK